MRTLLLVLAIIFVMPAAADAGRSESGGVRLRGTSAKVEKTAPKKQVRKTKQAKRTATKQTKRTVKKSPSKAKPKRPEKRPMP